MTRDELGQFKMATFSQLTGLSAGVLRAWERRYGLLEPVRLESGHRLYTSEDLAVIRRVSALLETGRSIGEVAALGRSALLSDPEAPKVGRRWPPADESGPVESLRARIIDAARRLSATDLDVALDEAFASLGPRTVVEKVIAPVSRELGERWRAGEVSVAGEHMVSAALVFRVQKLIEVARRGGGISRAPVLCACLPDEQHELGLLLVALELCSAGIEIVYFGRNLPFEDLERACLQLKPAAVCLSVVREELLLAHAPRLTELARRWRGQLAFHLGGSGVPESSTLEGEEGLVLWPASRPLDALVTALSAAQRP
jgi:DNA-binding transcriptional MerR regulator